MDTGEASIANSAQDARIRELELALAAHEGQVAALILEKEEASRSALARAWFGLLTKVNIVPTTEPTISPTDASTRNQGPLPHFPWAPRSL